MFDNDPPSPDDDHKFFVGMGNVAHPGPGWVGRVKDKLWSPKNHRKFWLFGAAALLLIAVSVLAAFLLWPEPQQAAQTPANEAERTEAAGSQKDDESAASEEQAPATQPAPAGGTAQKPATGGTAPAGGSSGSSGGSSGGAVQSCALPAYPTSDCTGVPAGWTPTTTITGNLVVSTPGAVIENYLVTGTIDVRAANVTIRKTRVYGSIDNFITNIIYGPLLIEDSEVVLPPGDTFSDDFGSAIGVANYTCRRCKIVGRAEGWRVGGSGYSGAGPVTIEHSYAKLQVTQAQCDAYDPHGDGIQGYGGPFATINHNTIDQRDDPCPTAPIFIPDQGNDGATVTDNLLAGGGYSLRLLGGNFPTVTGNKIVANTWGYGPVDVDCNLIGTWSGNATVTFNWTTGTITSQVQALNSC
jgi:hypothetical protein